VKDRWPQQGMCRPSAPARLGLRLPRHTGEGGARIYQKSAVGSSVRDIEQPSGEHVKITPQPPSFLATGSPPRSSRPVRHTSRGRSTWTFSGRPAGSGGDEGRPAANPSSSAAAEGAEQPAT
jgi:hypothetical protein